jgi:hypothetical protein
MDEHLNDWAHLTVQGDIPKTICIDNGKGQRLTLDLVDGVLTQGGDLPMDEGAKIFFKELQRVAALQQAITKSEGI